MKKPTTKSSILLLLAAATVVLTCMWFATRAQEARFMGRPISSWVVQDMLQQTCRSNVLAALNQYPTETINAVVEVVRGNLHETKFGRWWRQRTAHLRPGVRGRLPGVIGEETATGYFIMLAQQGITGKGPLSAAWTTKLISLMKDPDPRLRTVAVWAFPSRDILDIQHWDQEGQIRAALVCACRDPDPQVGWTAVTFLGKLRPVNGAAVAALVKACADPQLRRGAALSLAQIEQEPARAVPILIEEGLHDMSPMTRATFLGAVGNFGPQAGFAIPQLEAGLKDYDPEVQKAVKKALSLISPPATTNQGALAP